MDKLYISADIEGTCGITDWKETGLEDPVGAQFRKRMTEEVTAACEGACFMGVKEILVKDAHGSGLTIDASALPENARLLRGWTGSPESMMAGLDSSFSGVVFTGYHAGAGSSGNPLAHTMSLSIVRATLNGETLSEFGINARTAFSLGVPVLALSGDAAICGEARAMECGIRTAPVEEGRGMASISLHPKIALKHISDMVADAVGALVSLREDRARVPGLPQSWTLQTTYRSHGSAYKAGFFPGAVQTGSHEVRYESSRWFDILVFMHFAW